MTAFFLLTFSGGPNHVQNWSLIRWANQPTNGPNPAENEYDIDPYYGALPHFKTKVSLDTLDDKTLHLYTIRKQAETQSGEYYPLDDGFSFGLIASSGGGYYASTFIDLKPFGVADSLDIVRLGFNLTTNVPNTPEDQARLDNLLQLVLETRYLPNGDTLLPPHQVYTISDY